jgi:hypothetical protein
MPSLYLLPIAVEAQEFVAMAERSAPALAGSARCSLPVRPAGIARDWLRWEPSSAGSSGPIHVNGVFAVAEGDRETSARMLGELVRELTGEDGARGAWLADLTGTPEEARRYADLLTARALGSIRASELAAQRPSETGAGSLGALRKSLETPFVRFTGGIAAQHLILGPWQRFLDRYEESLTDPFGDLVPAREAIPTTSEDPALADLQALVDPSLASRDTLIASEYKRDLSALRQEAEYTTTLAGLFFTAWSVVLSQIGVWFAIATGVVAALFLAGPGLVWLLKRRRALPRPERLPSTGARWPSLGAVVAAAEADGLDIVVGDRASTGERGAAIRLWLAYAAAAGRPARLLATSDLATVKRDGTRAAVVIGGPLVLRRDDALDTPVELEATDPAYGDWGFFRQDPTASHEPIATASGERTAVIAGCHWNGPAILIAGFRDVGSIRAVGTVIRLLSPPSNGRAPWTDSSAAEGNAADGLAWMAIERAPGNRVAILAAARTTDP